MMTIMYPVSICRIAPFITTLFLTLACSFSSVPGINPQPTATLQSTFTPSPTATPTATPTPVPTVYLDAGDIALYDGDWTAALDAYQAALAEASDPGVKGDAQIGIGTVLLRLERYTEAIQALDTYLSDFPEHDRIGQAYFLRGMARQAIGELDGALADYDQYLVQRSGRIDSFVYERMGDLLRELGRPMDAIDRYQDAATNPRLSGTLMLQIKIGHAYFEAGDLSTALETFDGVKQQAPDGVTKASMNLIAGQILESMGNFDDAYARYLESVEQYPEAYDTYIGLIRLVDVGVPVDEFLRGYIDYSSGAYEPALAAFNRYLTASPTGTAFYYRGLTRRKLGDAIGALSDFEQVINVYPYDAQWANALLEKARTEWVYLDQHAAAIDTYLFLAQSFPEQHLGADALYKAGRIAEITGDLAQAGEIWARIPTEYSDDPLAYHGSFETGIVRYRIQDYTAARETFDMALTLALSSGQRAKANLWIGKTYAVEGNRDMAIAAWETAEKADPTGYYSVRAADLLADREPFQPLGLFDFSSDIERERSEAEAWMRSLFVITGPEPLFELDLVLANDERIIRGDEFWQLGLNNEARAEFEAVRKEVENDPEATYRLMHKLLDVGLYRSAILASRQILSLAGMDDAATMSAPIYFNRIRFSPYFGELILPEAVSYNLDGLFLLSLVRQESLFEGFATSYAAARGLMQVIPSTGQEIASKLGWPPGYTTDDLYRPVVSVRFGSFYLAQQRDLFDGDLFAALAAYNAGPGNALVWKELAPDDPDLFLEVIRMDQPYLYVRTIYEAFAIYNDLYSNPEG